MRLQLPLLGSTLVSVFVVLPFAAPVSNVALISREAPDSVTLSSSGTQYPWEESHKRSLQSVEVSEPPTQRLVAREVTADEPGLHSHRSDTLEASPHPNLEARAPTTLDQHLFNAITEGVLGGADLSPRTEAIIQKFINTFWNGIQSGQIDPTNFILFQPDDASREENAAAFQEAVERQGRSRGKTPHTAKTLLDLLPRDAWNALHRLSPGSQTMVLHAADALMAVFASDVATVVGDVKKIKKLAKLVYDYIPSDSDSKEITEWLTKHRRNPVLSVFSRDGRLSSSSIKRVGRVIKNTRNAVGFVVEAIGADSPRPRIEELPGDERPRVPRPIRDDDRPRPRKRPQRERPQADEFSDDEPGPAPRPAPRVNGTPERPRGPTMEPGRNTGPRPHAPAPARRPMRALPAPPPPTWNQWNSGGI